MEHNFSREKFEETNRRQKRQFNGGQSRRDADSGATRVRSLRGGEWRRPSCIPLMWRSMDRGCGLSSFEPVKARPSETPRGLMRLPTAHTLVALLLLPLLALKQAACPQQRLSIARI